MVVVVVVEVMMERFGVVVGGSEGCCTDGNDDASDHESMLHIEICIIDGSHGRGGFGGGFGGGQW